MPWLKGQSGNPAGTKPKVYAHEMVSRVTALYVAGHTQGEITVVLGCSQKVVYRLMKNHEIPRRIAAKRNQIGEANHAWKGSDAGYQAMHLRVYTVRGAPSRCEVCGTDSDKQLYDWANLTGNYADVNDYKRMCRPCHRKYDAGRRL